MKSKRSKYLVVCLGLAALVAAAAYLSQRAVFTSSGATLDVPAIKIGDVESGILAIRYSDKNLWAGFIESYDDRQWAALQTVKIKGKVLSLGIDERCATIESSPSWDASADRTAEWLYEEYHSQFEVPPDFFVTTSTVRIGPMTVRVAGSKIVTAGFTTDRKTCWIVSGDSHTPAGLGISIVGLGKPGPQYSRCVLQIFEAGTGRQIGQTFSLPMDRPWVSSIQSIHVSEHGALILWDNFGSLAWIVRLRDGTATAIPACVN